MQQLEHEWVTMRECCAYSAPVAVDNLSVHPEGCATGEPDSAGSACPN